MLPGPCSLYQYAGVDQEILDLLQIPKGHAARAHAFQLRVRTYRSVLFWRADPDRRRGRRPAVRSVRAGMLPSGSCQEHLWYGMLPADEHGREAGIFPKRAGNHHRLGTGRESGVCPGRFDLCGRGCHPVAQGRDASY